MRSSRFAIAVVLAIVAAGCSSGSDAARDETSTSTSVGIETEATADESSAVESGDGSDDAGDGAGDSGDDDATEDPIPVRPVPTQVSDETSHWVGVNAMSASAIDITWSEVEGDDVVYQLFRFETEVFRSGSASKDDVELDTPHAEVIGALRLVDDDVEPGTFYTYILRVIADDEVLERRWTDVLAVDDTTPPTAIVGVEFEVTAEGVLMEWSPSSDDVEFGSYGVFRTDGEGDARYIGGGGDIGQTSFLDDTVFGDGAPADGIARYEIVAFDFHNNRSDPAVIEVTLN